MADFNRAFDKTMGHEGGYSNDPVDAGGETYRGISRVYHPTWHGWLFIDGYKSSGAPIDTALLDEAVRAFYRQHYWEPNRCGDMPQAVADEVFDTGVNMGVGRAAKFLQRALNCLNRNGSLYADLVDDGDVGPATLAALKLLPSSDHETLLKIMNVMQGQHYIEYMTKSPTQEKYARGWFARVALYGQETR